MRELPRDRIRDCLLGASAGVAALPTRWLAVLDLREVIEGLAERL